MITTYQTLRLRDFERRGDELRRRLPVQSMFDVIYCIHCSFFSDALNRSDYHKLRKLVNDEIQYNDVNRCGAEPVQYIMQVLTARDGPKQQK